MLAVMPVKSGLRSYGGLRLLQVLIGKDSRIHVYHSVAQEGAENDRNSVLKGAHGRWIAFLDCGDVWEPEKLGRPNIFTKLLWQYRVLCYAEHVNPVVALWRNIQYLWYSGVKRIKYSQKV